VTPSIAERLRRETLFPEDERFLGQLFRLYERRHVLPCALAFPSPGERPAAVPLRVPLRRWMPPRPEPCFFTHLEDVAHREAERRSLRLPGGRPEVRLAPVACPEDEAPCPWGFVTDREVAFVDAVVVDVRFALSAACQTAGPDDLVQALEAAGLPPPTAILATGDGWQRVWLLRRRLAVRGVGSPVFGMVRRFRDRIHAALRDFGADPSGLSVVRPFRLPLSWNGSCGCVVHVVRNGPLLRPEDLRGAAFGGAHW